MITKYINKKLNFFFNKHVVKAVGRMIDEDTGTRLPLAIHLEDSNFSVNIMELCSVNEPQGKTGVSTRPYNPVSKTLPESYTTLQRRRKENRIRA